MCFTLWGCSYMGYLGIGVFIVFTLLNQAQSILRTNLLANVLPRWLGPAIQIILLLFQVSCANTLVQKVPTPEISIIACILSPLMQLQFVLQFAFVSIPFDNTITFKEITTDIYPGFNLAIIFTIAVCMTVFWGLLTLYLWPLYIEVDPENPARWYYIF